MERSARAGCYVYRVLILVAAAEVEGPLHPEIFRLSGNARSDHDRRAGRLIQPEGCMKLAVISRTADPQASAQQSAVACNGGKRHLARRCISIRPPGNLNHDQGRNGLSLAGGHVLQSGGRRTEQVGRERPGLSVKKHGLHRRDTKRRRSRTLRGGCGRQKQTAQSDQAVHCGSAARDSSFHKTFLPQVDAGRARYRTTCDGASARMVSSSTSYSRGNFCLSSPSSATSIAFGSPNGTATASSALLVLFPMLPSILPMAWSRRIRALWIKAALWFGPNFSTCTPMARIALAAIAA